ncbi:MAG: glutamine--fructose-6-phosphate transaminase (isomerizing) [Christensenellales bacterium]|jgi:glucosamine--fructose-6-phosphate aminotransferase (isomerizing)
MCGIVGYTGQAQSVDILMDGLEKLAYRGYDSAGVAVWNQGDIQIRKAQGKLDQLQKELANRPVSGTLGIGHTRWATHGEPSFVNSHPHTDEKDDLAIVHNGIIENYFLLKQDLMRRGYEFKSETDTEVIAHLLMHYNEGNLLEAICKAMAVLEGSFAVAIISRNKPDAIYCMCKESPLVIGHDGSAGYIASDIPAILQYTRDVYFMENYETAIVRPQGLEFFDRLGNRIHKQPTRIEWDVESAQKGNFPHFMLKEIFEQPTALKNTLDQYIDTTTHTIKQDCMPYSKTQVQSLRGLTIMSCGTAYHAGIVGKHVIEKLARIPVDVDIASEFRYRDPILQEGDACIVVSQSGETADTIAAMRLAQQEGIHVSAICNVVGSKIAREADRVLYTYAGPEIAVASTKAYVTQLAVFYVLALDLAQKRGLLNEQDLALAIDHLYQTPAHQQTILDTKEDIQYFASRAFDHKNVFFIGRGLDYALAMESALKLKEISYIHSESYAAGELKHGTIALIEPGSLVVALATQPSLFEKMANNIEEVRVRGALVLAVVNGENPSLCSTCRHIWTLPETDPLFAPLVSIVPLQLFAYYMAAQKGCDVDKPRNLAKSVTVE